MSASRRLAREIALKTLYQVAVGGMTSDDALRGAWEANHPDPSDRDAQLAWDAVREYSGRLVDGVMEHGEDFDATIRRYSRGWELDRMPTVDRILLHIALQEMLHTDDVPVGVVINEAVELAKEYSTEESGRFVNGILGAYARKEGPESNKK